MGWPPFGPDDRAALRASSRAARWSTPAGDATVMATAACRCCRARSEYDWGMAVLAVGGRGQSERPSAWWCAPRSRTCTAATSSRRSPSSTAPIRLEPGQPGGARLADRHRARAHGSRQLRRGARLGDAIAGASTRPSTPTLWMLIAANAHLGRMDEARRFLAEFRRLAPGVTVASIRDRAARQGSGPDRRRSSTGCASPACRPNRAFTFVESVNSAYSETMHDPGRTVRRSAGIRDFRTFHRPLKDIKRPDRPPSPTAHARRSAMLTTLSILSRDQGPKWQEPKPERRRAPEAAPGRLQDLVRGVLARIAVSRRPATSRSRA